MDSNLATTQLQKALPCLRHDILCQPFSLPSADYLSLSSGCQGLLMGCGEVSVTWPGEAVQTIHLKGLFGACLPLPRRRLLSFATSCADF